MTYDVYSRTGPRLVDFGPGGQPLAGLGAAGADVEQVRLLGDLDARVFAELTAAQDLLVQVAKYDSAREPALAQELATFFEVANRLEAQISQMALPAQPAQVAEFEGDIQVLSVDVTNYKLRVAHALRQSISASQTRMALFAIIATTGAVGVGWYVWNRSRKRGGAMKRRR